MADKAKEIAAFLSFSAISFKNKKEITTDEEILKEEILKSEVDLISKEIGWSEDEILSLPAIRRKSYVSIIQSEAK